MESSIFEVIEAHNLGQLEAMLRRGADPDQVNPEIPNPRPLHAAIVQLEYGGPIELVKILLRHGAGINRTAPGIGGGTPLLCAMFNDLWDAARFLLEVGADPNVGGEEGDTPLRWCAEIGNLEFMKVLLEKGAGRTIDGFGGFTGRSALGWAAHRLDAPMVATLLAAGARPDATDLDRRTARQCMPDYDPARKEAWLEVSGLLAAAARGD